MCPHLSTHATRLLLGFDDIRSTCRSAWLDWKIAKTAEHHWTMTALDSDSTCSMTHVQQLQLHLLLSLPFTLQCHSAWLSQELTLTDNTLVTGLKIVFADHKWRLIGYRWQVTQCLYKGEYLVGFSTIQNWTLVQDYTNSLHSGSRLRLCLSGTHLACRIHLSTFFVVDYHYTASWSQHCSAT